MVAPANSISITRFSCGGSIFPQLVGEKELSELEVLHVMPRRHVTGVACFQLVVQALHQLILGLAVTTSMLVYIHAF